MVTGLFILGGLVLLSGFFSGMETAFFSLGDIEIIDIEKSKTRKSEILLRLLADREKLLSTILIGNNLVNISASALNAMLAVKYANYLNISTELSVTLSSLMLTLVIILFGEITPKIIAITHNRRLSLLFSTAILGLTVVLMPVTFLFSHFSKGITHIFRRGDGKQHSISESTVINVVSKGEELGVINETEKKLIQNVFNFDEKEVYPIMTARTSVFALYDTLTIGEAKEQLLEKQFSRVPVYNGSIDNITGIVNLKSVFNEIVAGNEDRTLAEISQKALFVYETLTLSSLLEQFKLKKIHMAIVVDEFGGMAGIVTLEDILEELVGEIYDEKDKIDTHVKKLGSDRWLIDGTTDIFTVNKSIEGEIPVDGDFSTLQGLIMSKLERMPVEGDMVDVKQYKITVKQMEKNEILSVLLELKSDNADDESEKDH